MKTVQVTDPVTYHGEGAVWSPDWGGLKFVDMLAGAVLSLDQDSGAISRLEVGSPIAAMVRPRAGGGFVVMTEREFTVWGAAGKEWTSPPLWPDHGRRFNEGGCDPQGRVICGSLPYDRVEGTAEVYRLDLDRSTEQLLDGVTISNGLGFTADGAAMYYVDSRTRRIDIFDFDGDRLLNRRPFVAIEDGAGSPDGLWVDEADGIWVALYGGSAVRHYDATGRLADVVEVDGASQVTSCTFGGTDRRTLYLTTSRENLPEDAQPLAGSVFSADAGIAGLPVLPARL